LALGVVPAIQVCVGATKKGVDALLKAGHDESRIYEGWYYISARTEKCGEGSGAKSVLESNQNGVAFALMR